MSNFLTVHHMERRHVLFVLPRVGDCVVVLTEPLVGINPFTVVADPQFRKNASKLFTRVPLRTSQFNVGRLGAQLCQFIFSEEAILLLFCVQCSRLWGINTEEAHSLTNGYGEAQVNHDIHRISINDAFEG